MVNSVRPSQRSHAEPAWVPPADAGPSVGVARSIQASRPAARAQPYRDETKDEASLVAPTARPSEGPSRALSKKTTVPRAPVVQAARAAASRNCAVRNVVACHPTVATVVRRRAHAPSATNRKSLRYGSPPVAVQRAKTTTQRAAAVDRYRAGDRSA
jgi:hypothetical protein